MRSLPPHSSRLKHGPVAARQTRAAADAPTRQSATAPPVTPCSKSPCTCSTYPTRCPSAPFTMEERRCQRRRRPPLRLPRGVHDDQRRGPVRHVAREPPDAVSSLGRIHDDAIVTRQLIGMRRAPLKVEMGRTATCNTVERCQPGTLPCPVWWRPNPDRGVHVYVHRTDHPVAEPKVYAVACARLWPNRGGRSGSGASRTNSHALAGRSLSNI